MSKGSLHLAYWSILGRFSENNNVFNVAIDMPKMRRELVTLEGLKPNKKDRDDFRYNGDSWDNFRVKYITKISSNEDSKKDIERIKNLLDSGQDVVVCCWEKFMPCHRFILGQIFFSMGYEVFWYDGIIRYEYEDNMYKYKKGIIDTQFIKDKEKGVLD